MDVTFGVLLTLTALIVGWIGKGFMAAKNSGKTEADALHHVNDFDKFKKETGLSFADLHSRIDRHRERQEGFEIRQSEKFYEILKGQGIIEGQLNTMLKLFNQRDGGKL